MEHGKILPVPETLSGELGQKGGAFVSLKKEGQLRGCIGTLEPVHSSLADEIIHNAVNAATKDPRFSSVSTGELPSIRFSVDVLTPLEEVSDLSRHDCKRHGLVVKCEERQGVLLPDLEGVDTAGEQLRICLKKGRIDPKECFQMYRFEVIRYH